MNFYSFRPVSQYVVPKSCEEIDLENVALKEHRYLSNIECILKYGTVLLTLKKNVFCDLRLELHSCFVFDRRFFLFQNMSTTHKPPTPSGHVSPSSRGASQLSSIVSEFVSLVEASPECSINIDEASKRLKVPKRRLYEVINVFEGASLMHKTEKHSVQWHGLANSRGVSSLETHCDSVVERE